ncbi:uncharacterized protein hmgxb4b isoform X6 [Xiphophorus couchianus]|uniref:uncharacterized protein hmgxb4b isoform X6 n=1 Tax=Xiphophorus couchianus TaxID=32473 RepID=UPI001015F60C|nr:uncharacterized protein LOC114144254 isoform X6 [Xiphophorus couchianus]
MCLFSNTPDSNELLLRPLQSSVACCSGIDCKDSVNPKEEQKVDFLMDLNGLEQANLNAKECNPHKELIGSPTERTQHADNIGTESEPHWMESSCAFPMQLAYMPEDKWMMEDPEVRTHTKRVCMSGSLSLFLDTLLCALAPLMCLTTQIPELTSCTEHTLASTLENVAYLMPGL